MAHVLGFGAVWKYLNLYSAACTPGTPGPIYYTGVNGNAAYDTTNCPTWSADPLIETIAGPGSGCSHWAERNYNTELMTPFAEVQGTNSPISVFTIGAMKDIWGSVNYAEADPFTCSAPAALISQSAQQGDWLHTEPILRPRGWPVNATTTRKHRRN